MSQIIIPEYDHPEWKPSRDRKLTGAPILFENGFSWEMDEHGSHRIVDLEGRGGEWSMYNSIARSPCGNYIVVTNYYDGTVPAETLLKVSIVARVSPATA